MDSHFGKKLAAALSINSIPPPGPIQRIFNEYMKHMDGRVIQTPLPEEVHLRRENFPYWIKLENRDPSRMSEWVSSKVKVVLPPLEAGTFDETGFRYDEKRARAIFHIPEFLQKPNCIHLNLRNANRGKGGIRGDYMYVSYLDKKSRKVAFTIRDQRIGKIVLVTSFWSNAKWVGECAHVPPMHVGHGRSCECK